RPIGDKTESHHSAANNYHRRTVGASGRYALKYRDREPGESGADQQRTPERADLVSERPDVAGLAQIKHGSVRQNFSMKPCVAQWITARQRRPGFAVRCASDSPHRAGMPPRPAPTDEPFPPRP